MFFGFRRWFRSLSMKHQIILLDSFILILALLLLISAILIELRIFYYISNESSVKILNKIDSTQISIATKLTSSYIHRKHQQSINILEHSSFLYKYFAQNQQDITLYNQTEVCLTADEQKNYPYLKHTSYFCYQLSGTSNQTIPNSNQNILILNQATTITNVFGLALNVELPLYFQIADTSTTKYSCSYPRGELNYAYNTQTRPWYINHLYQMSQYPNSLYFFSEPYSYFYTSTGWEFALTHSLFNKYNEFIAVGKLSVSVYDTNYQYVQFNFILINVKGQLIFNGLQNQASTVDIQYIYDVNITGFNYTDWQIIENKALYGDPSQTIQLYNKYYETYVNLQCSKFHKENFTLIMFTNVTAQIDLFKQLDGISQIMLNFLTLCQYIQIGAYLISIIVILVSIHFIFKPLTQLTKAISQHILELGNNIDREFFKLFQPNNVKINNLFTSLNHQFLNVSNLLNRNQHRKSLICKTYENIKFNLKENNLNFGYIKHVQQELKNTPSQEHKLYFSLLF